MVTETRAEVIIKKLEVAVELTIKLYGSLGYNGFDDALDRFKRVYKSVSEAVDESQ